MENLKTLFKELERPAIIAVEASDTNAQITLHVPESLAWFEGHFPEQPVLPGVVQVDWAGKIGRALFVKNSASRQLTNIKFKTMVLPGTSMILELIYSAEKGILKFHFFNDSESFSMGSFKFIPS
ncbi:hypothetical protein CA267_009215 [Alteromonas pelagimontana]|uniref:ApeI dehydratase-like domain-containing protein n=1 Tax=Alteromonas pelagimontana TaxID=1858656 RepID=A0A6M4MCP3_9ALTE|nr:hypothetical protein [Alteromonas pelagimontana]QJR80944.1 hypothetical protein CA267_009215 [Alteromonas pelagimontana]